MKMAVAISGLVFVMLGQSAEVQAEVVIDTVTVGNPGNAGEWSGESYGGSGPDRICGAVGYRYNTGKYEVTAGQYTEFLNAVAATDTYELYNVQMWSSELGCKIQRSGTPGSYIYSVAADRADRPVNCITWADSARFCNWLTNGQPTGAQDLSTTEDGSYYLDGAMTGLDIQAVTREAVALYVIPSEDEWYKAAFHKNDGVTGNYWDYPTGTDFTPSNVLIDPDPGNNANFYEGEYTIGSPYYRTEIGEFENSESSYETFDQGGNVWEWNESVIYDTRRGVSGGAFSYDVFNLRAADRNWADPTAGGFHFGFRVAFVPEPTTLPLLALGGLLVARRRR